MFHPISKHRLVGGKNEARVLFKPTSRIRMSFEKLFYWSSDHLNLGDPTPPFGIIYFSHPPIPVRPTSPTRPHLITSEQSLTLIPEAHSSGIRATVKFIVAVYFYVLCRQAFLDPWLCYGWPWQAWLCSIISRRTSRWYICLWKDNQLTQALLSRGILQPYC